MGTNEILVPISLFNKCNFFLNGALQFLNLLVGSMVNVLGISGAKPHVIVLVYASIT